MEIGELAEPRLVSLSNHKKFHAFWGKTNVSTSSTNALPQQQKSAVKSKLTALSFLWYKLTASKHSA
ncbi:hypothetical protein [Actinobacillus porcinus]|uniref:hypothetical protein n=1 Tax=Actinobacillus porcinus TaxID=51048 RepID=UPI0023553CFB|nr:hypothetical protein [Actinobacillus porcinus]